MRFIGIDLGDGESAVTSVTASGSMIPQVLSLGQEKSILSVVGLREEHPVIGDEVLLDRRVKEKSVRFKSRYLTDPAAKTDIRRFAQGLYERLQAGGNALSDPETYVALGCPAGWNEGERKAYAALIEEAGFRHVQTVSESRAAFLYAHYCNELGLSPEMLARPSLVIDIGSSTTDFAYIVDGRETNVGVFGEVRLGGGLLDKAILNNAIEDAPDGEEIGSILAKSHSWYSMCELTARRLKEQYFITEDTWKNTPCETAAPICMDVNHPMVLPIRLNGDTMARLLKLPMKELNGKSFLQALEDTLAKAAENTKDNPPELLILTGGASRMAFFQKACQKHFPQAALAITDEPEFSIARGLGIAARTDYQLSAFRQRLQEFADSGEILSEVEENKGILLVDLVPELVQLVVKEAVVPAVGRIAQGTITPADMKEVILRDAEKALSNPENLQEANNILSLWVAQYLTGAQQKLDELCDLYQVDRADLSLAHLTGCNLIQKIRLPMVLKMAVKTPGLLRAPLLGQLLQMLLRAQVSGVLSTARVSAQLNRQLSDPKGKFARQLTDEIETAMMEQLKAHIQKVEIHIS